MNPLHDDHPLHILLQKAGDIILANLLFLLCSIPLITIGPALTALYHCMLRTVKGNNTGTVRLFLKAFRDNFMQSLSVSFAFAGAAVLLSVNIVFLTQNQTEAQFWSRLFLILSYVLLYLLFVLALYLFPVMAAFSNTTKKLFCNSILYAFLHVPTTLIMSVITLLPAYMSYRDTSLLPLYAFCWFFFGFALICFINSLLLYRIFTPYLNTDT